MTFVVDCNTDHPPHLDLYLFFPGFSNVSTVRLEKVSYVEKMTAFEAKGFRVSKTYLSCSGQSQRSAGDCLMANGDIQWVAVIASEGFSPCAMMVVRSEKSRLIAASH